jgi:hypothetical protein
MGEPDVRRNTFIILFTINNKNFIEAEQKLFLNGFIIISCFVAIFTAKKIEKSILQ